MDGGVNMVAALEPGRELRVGAGAAQVDHEEARHGSGSGRAHQLTDDVQHQIDAGRDAGAAVALAVFDIEPVLQHAGGGSRFSEQRAIGEVRGAGVVVEQAGAGGQQGARADRHEPDTGPDIAPQPGDDFVGTLQRRFDWSEPLGAEDQLGIA